MGEAIVADRHLCDDGKIRQAAHRAQPLVQLVHVGERLEDESVHAACEETLRLALEEGERLFARGRAERLDAQPQRPDCADDACPARRRLTGELGRRLVDPLGLRRETVARELRGIRPERVRLEDLGAGAHVRLVHFLDELRLLQV